MLIRPVSWMETCEDIQKTLERTHIFFLRCYPFDVNEAILWLAELTDMVFVFFDPIGQVYY